MRHMFHSMQHLFQHIFSRFRDPVKLTPAAIEIHPRTHILHTALFLQIHYGLIRIKGRQKTVLLHPPCNGRRTGIALAHPQEHHRLRQRSPQRGFQGGRAVILLRGFTCFPFHWTEPASLLYYSRKISKIQYKKFFIFGKIVLKKYYSCVIVIINRNSGLSGRIYMPQFWNGGEAHVLKKQ